MVTGDKKKQQKKMTKTKQNEWLQTVRYLCARRASILFFPLGSILCTDVSVVGFSPLSVRRKEIVYWLSLFCFPVLSTRSFIFFALASSSWILTSIPENKK